MFCPRCGTEAGLDQRFCAKCGAAFGTPEGAQGATVAVAAQAAPEATAAAVVPPPAQALPVTGPTLAAPTLAVAALTHPIPDGGLTLEEVVAWLQSGGYAAKVATREDGKRHIESSSQGTLFNIFKIGRA